MTTQIVVVELPDDLLAAVDRLVGEGTFPSRSAVVRRALDGLVAASERATVDHAFAHGFREVPETADEMSDATRLAVEAINDEPWEKWW